MPSYEVQNHKLFKVDDEGERKLLCNFVPEITEEVRYVDGLNTDTVLTIRGKMPGEGDGATELPEVKVSAKDWPNMAWVVQAWGIRAVIGTGTSVKEDIRQAMQLLSSPRVVTVHRALGWSQGAQARMYIHAGGAVGEKGEIADVRVQLATELSRYNLSTIVPAETGVNASLDLVRKVGPHGVTWPLFAGVLAPLLGPVDFAIHLTGRTGTFKSELISLFLSHFGKMDARHLPGSWSSTANALEAQAYYAKNAPFVVDDFVPSGTSWQVRAYQQTADKLIRAQGNQAGRARLNDTSNLQSTMYPRGIIVSTGEDTPEGHSVRARMLILELSPGDIAADELTRAQANRALYTATTKGFVQWLAVSYNEELVASNVERLRPKYVEIGHTRTPTMLARLVVTVGWWVRWLVDAKLASKALAQQLVAEAEAAIVATGQEQRSYLESADPCDLFAAGLRNVFGSGLGHVRSLNGGIPAKPTLLGWVEEGERGDVPTFKSRGPVVGWIDWKRGELLVEINTGYAVVKKVVGAELSLTKQTMLKRLRDAGFVTRSDDARQRNTIRIKADGQTRQVIALHIEKVLDTQEVPSERE